MPRRDPAGFTSSAKRPSDFDSFWADTLSLLASVPPNASFVRDELRSDDGVDVFDGETGKLISRIAGDLVLKPVSKDLIDDAIAVERERVRDAPTGSETELYARVIDDREALPVPPTLPVLGRMLASPSGWLLALRLDLDEDPVRAGDPATWDLFTPGGRLHGRLVLPPTTRVLGLTDDGILAVVLDELDVQSFVQYRFQIRALTGQ